MPPEAAAAAAQEKRKAAREVINVLEEISTLLNTNLNRTQISLCVSLVENGMNPEALATVIKGLRKGELGGGRRDKITTTRDGDGNEKSGD